MTLNRLIASSITIVFVFTSVAFALEPDYTTALGPDFLLVAKNFEQKYSAFSAVADIIYHQELYKNISGISLSDVQDIQGQWTIKRSGEEYSYLRDDSVKIVTDGELVRDDREHSFILSTPASLTDYSFHDNRLTISPSGNDNGMWRDIGVDVFFTARTLGDNEIKARIIERDGRQYFEGYRTKTTQMQVPGYEYCHILLAFDVATGHFVRKEIWFGGEIPGSGILGNVVTMAYNEEGLPACLNYQRTRDYRPHYDYRMLTEGTATYKSFELTPDMKSEDLRITLPHDWVLVDDKIMGAVYKTDVLQGLLW